jgi:sec-independent protein translocase protein TatA
MTGKLEGIIILALIVLLLFGAKRIPELARNIGASVKEVKNGFNGTDNKTSSVNEAKKSKTKTK